MLQHLQLRWQLEKDNHVSRKRRAQQQIEQVKRSKQAQREQARHDQLLAIVRDRWKLKPLPPNQWARLPPDLWAYLSQWLIPEDRVALLGVCQQMRESLLRRTAIIFPLIAERWQTTKLRFKNDAEFYQTWVPEGKLTKKPITTRYVDLSEPMIEDYILLRQLQPLSLKQRLYLDYCMLLRLTYMDTRRYRSKNHILAEHAKRHNVTVESREKDAPLMVAHAGVGSVPQAETGRPALYFFPTEKIDRAMRVWLQAVHDEGCPWTFTSQQMGRLVRFSFCLRQALCRPAPEYNTLWDQKVITFPPSASALKNDLWVAAIDTQHIQLVFTLTYLVQEKRIPRPQALSAHFLRLFLCKGHAELRLELMRGLRRARVAIQVPTLFRQLDDWWDALGEQECLRIVKELCFGYPRETTELFLNETIKLVHGDDYRTIYLLTVGKLFYHGTSPYDLEKSKPITVASV